MQLFPHHKKVAKQAHGVAHKIVQAAPSPPAVLSLHQWLHPRTGQHAAFEQPPTAPELQSNNEQTNNATVLRIPRDQTLDKMDIILTKTMRGLTVTEFYDWVWKETKGPLYQPWLEESGKQIVQVHEWKPSTTAGSWDQESYQEERMVQFEFVRTTHLYTGPPVAQVSHMHQGRVEYDHDNDDIPIRCILAMTVEMQGIPFAECFNVQIRWVVTRDSADEKTLHVQAGLFVNFLQHTIVAGKIRSGTSEETTKGQIALFQYIQEFCRTQVPSMENRVPSIVASTSQSSESFVELVHHEQQKPTAPRQPVCFALFSGILNLFPKRQSSILSNNPLDNEDDDVDEYYYAKDDPVMKRVRQAEIKLKLFKAKYQLHQSAASRNLFKPHKSATDHSQKQIQWIESELTDINSSLKSILRELKHI